YYYAITAAKDQDKYFIYTINSSFEISRIEENLDVNSFRADNFFVQGSKIFFLQKSKSSNFNIAYYDTSTNTVSQSSSFSLEDLAK
ncbi:MAG: hypothetical protein K5839_06140, partial [Treponemataceae bacterium]|nr:hypothetical protein [Treponemataceae bacterium]